MYNLIYSTIGALALLATVAATTAISQTPKLDLVPSSGDVITIKVAKGVSRIDVKYLTGSGRADFEHTFDVTPGYRFDLKVK